MSQGTPSHRRRLLQAQQQRRMAETQRSLRRVEAHVPTAPFAQRSRAWVVAAILGGLFTIVAARAAALAVLPNERLDRRLAAQHERVVQIAPERGPILDRLGRPLAVSVERRSVYADPALVEDPQHAATLLAPHLGLDRDALAATLAESERRFVWLARRPPHAVSQEVEALNIPGIALMAEPHRDYPSGSLAAHVLGFVGTDGEGLEGLEARYDDALRGDAQEVRVVRDGRRRATNMDALLSRRSTEGGALQLTIDHTVQHRAEAALAAAVDEFGAAGGFVIAMEPQSGAILALASNPTFDPNDWRGSAAPARRNRAVSDVFEPGSTIKPMVIAELLAEGKASRTEEVFCENGALKVGGRVVHDAHPHGTLTVDGVLQTSSNIGTVKLCQRLGRTGLEGALRRLGLGEKTGIDVFGEERGLLRPSSTWSEIGFATHCFGQGLAVTGMQMATAFSTLVNGGHPVQPHVVAQLRGFDGAVLKDFTAEQRDPVLTASASADIREMMQLVVGEGGTGQRASLDDYSCGGKTGTAQKVKNGRYEPGLYVSSFIGFAPADAPAVVTYVVIDEPTRNGHYGGTVAGPVWKEVTRTALRALGVAPDRVEPLALLPAAAHPTPSPEPKPEVAEGTMPDLVGRSAREALRLMAAAGVIPELNGSGVVVRQSPAVGVELSPATRVELALAFPEVGR